MRGREIFEDVCWHDGLLVTAQHMQLLKKALKPQILEVITNIRKNCCGVKELDLRLDKIASGRIELTRLLCVFKDGSVVDFRGSKTIELSKLEGGTYVVFACVTKEDNTKSSLESGRCVREERGPFVDETDSSNSRVVSVLHLDPKLLLEEDMKDHHHGLPIVKISINDGIYRVLNFLPPKCFFDENDEILGKIFNIIGKANTLHKRLEEKTEYYRSNVVVSHEASVTSRNYFVLATVLPRINILVSLQEYGTRELFTELAALYYAVAACTVLKIKYDLFFDFYDIVLSFERLLFELDGLLNLLVNEDVEVEVLQFKHGILEWRFSDDYCIDGRVYFALNGEKVTDQIVANAAIGLKAEFGKILSSRILGIRRQLHTEHKEIASKLKINIMQNMKVFSLDASSLKSGEIYSFDFNINTPINGVVYKTTKK